MKINSFQDLIHDSFPVTSNSRIESGQMTVPSFPTLHCIIILCVSFFFTTFSPVEGADISALDDVSNRSDPAAFYTRIVSIPLYLRVNAKHTHEYLKGKIYQADIHKSMGDYRSALSVLVSDPQVMKKVDKIEDESLKLLYFKQVAELYFLTGRLKKTAQYLEHALTAAHMSGNLMLEALVLHKIGNLYETQKDRTRYLEKSINIYQMCLDRLEPSINGALAENIADLRAKTLIRIAGLHGKLSTSAPDRVIDFVKKAGLQIDQQGNRHEKAENLLALGKVAREIAAGYREKMTTVGIGYLESRALKMFSDAGSIGKKIGDFRIVSQAGGYTAKFYEAEGRYDDAIRLTRRAIFHAQQTCSPDILYQWHWQLGRLFRHIGKPDDAVRSYQKAIQTLDSVRVRRSSDYGAVSVAFEKEIKPIFLELSALFLHQARAAKTSVNREVRLKQARDVMESLKIAELEDFYKDECLAEFQKRVTTLDRSPPKTAIIYIISLPGCPVLLLDLPKGIRQIPVDCNTDLFYSTVQRFREKLQTWNDCLDEAQFLYRSLVEPMIPDLQQQDIRQIVVVPDGPLSLIPFSALHDGDRFLIEDYPVATIPALRLTDTGPIEREHVKALIAGLSIGRDTGKLKSIPLTRVKDEIRDVEKLTDGKVLLDNDFTLERFKEEINFTDYNVIHIASHGIFGRRPEETFILTADSRLSIDAIEKLMAVGRYRNRPVELLTLSACQTATGNESAVYGLAGVAVKAGVASVLATLWSVDDRASSKLVSRFYRQMLVSRKSKATALQNAQIEMLSNPEFSHPGFWAPFLLIGNWR